ncbi:nef attachable domain protein [Chlamydia psittaci C6/98]|nr:nef attachable domain protein [Chlamydia psittaci C6/98]
MKRKYLPLKTGKRLSEKLLCVLLIRLTQLQLSPQEAFPEDSSFGICNVIFGSPCSTMVKKEISSVKTGKKLSEKLLCVLLIHLTEYIFPPPEASP